jgi:hypothetical protein
MNRYVEYYIAPSLFLLVLTIISCWKILSTSGLVLYGDFLAAYSVDKFLDLMVPLWDQYGSLPTFEQLLRLPYRFLLYIPHAIGLISDYAYFKILFLGTLYLAGISMYYSVLNIISSEYKKIGDLSIVVALLSGIFYMFNPWAIQRMHQQAFLFGYALTPIIFYLCYKIVKTNKNKTKYLLLLGFLLSLSAATPHYFIFNSFVVVSWFAFDIIMTKKELKKIINYASYLVLSYSAFLLLSLYWIMPIVFSSASPEYAPSSGIVDVLSRNSDILNVSRLISTWFVRTSYMPSNTFAHVIWIFSSISIPVIAFASILLVRKRKIVLYLTLLLLILLQLGMGAKSLVPRLYYWLVFSTPIGWVFRGPNKWVGLIAFTYIILIALFLAELATRVEKKKLIKYGSILLVTSLLFSIYAYPNAEGFLTKVYMPAKIPGDIHESYSYLNSDNATKVLYLSLAHPFNVRLLDWGKVAVLDTISSPIPSISTFTPHSNLFFLFAYDNLLLKNSTDNFGKYLETAGVSHVVYHNSTVNEWYYPIFPGFERNENRIMVEDSKIIESLNIQRDLNLTKNFEKVYIYSSIYPANEVRVSNEDILLIGGMNTLEALYNLDPFNPSHLSVLLSDQLYIKNLNYDTIITSLEDINPIDIKEITESNKVPLAKYTNENSLKEQAWSRAYSYEPLHGEWHRGPLHALNLNNWQNDYGEGFVFTMAYKKIPEDLKPLKNDIIRSWVFNREGEFKEWEKINPEKRFNTIQKLSRVNNVLKAELYNTTGEWKSIKSPLIPVEYDHYYLFKFRIKGENASNVHINVFEYNSKIKTVGEKLVKRGIGTGNFSWKDEEVIYTPQRNLTKYLQLQVWHGYKTKQPLPSSVWLDNVEVYEITKYTEPVNLKIPFGVDKLDNYKLFVRYFKNQRGEKIKVYLDDKSIDITTKDQLNKFVWKDLGTFHLEKGEHTLVLENVKGFNALNLFALIPEKEYENAKQEISEVLQNKTIIYLFEAESDLYRDDATISKKFGGEASNGEVLEIADGKAWQEIEIIKNGTYRLAIRAKGDFRVQIADKEFEFHNSNLTYWYAPTFELNRGEYNLTITPSGTPIANFSFEPVSNIETEIIERLPAGIVSFSTDSYSGNSSLEVSSNVTEEGGLWLYTPEVNVTPGKRYSAITHMKYKNVVESYISIEGYNKTAGEWIELMQVPSGQTGTSDWKEYKQILTIPEDISKIRFVLNAGWINDQEMGNGITWFDDISVYPVKDYLDVVWLYSTKNNETLNELFKTNETPAEVINYTKINPTKYEVKVNATKPFMLSFAEAYDPLWEARIYKDGEKVEVVKSIPLYSVINGFWIDETGDLEIEIRYKPQEWFEVGLWISVTTFIGCIGYLFYDWRRGKGGKWALRIGARWHNAGNVVNKGFREGVQRLKKKQKRKN